MTRILFEPMRNCPRDVVYTNSQPLRAQNLLAYVFHMCIHILQHAYLYIVERFCIFYDSKISSRQKLRYALKTLYDEILKNLAILIS